MAHEAEIWNEFRTVMLGADYSQWLYNQGSATGARPGDLGYFVGFRIAEAYYGRATDKLAAVREILEVRDSQMFLQQSGYAPAAMR
jgi:hypothetical protein